MPRIVDHEERRRELASAVWAIIREEGLPAVTIRAVAQRSGWSSGAVRHYLPTREAILTFAAQQVTAAARDYMTGYAPTGDDRADFRSLLLATLPLDELSRMHLEVWLAFVGDAVSSDGPAQHALLYDDLHAFLLEALGHFAAEAVLAHDAVSALAIELHALLDGLAVHLLLRQLSPEQAEATIDQWLDRVFIDGDR